MQLATEPPLDMGIAITPSDQAAAVATGNVAGRLERLPMSAYQRKIFAIIASAWLVDQIDVALLTFLLGSIVVAFDLSPTQAGQLAAMTFAGQLVGNILAGTLSDRFGRTERDRLKAYAMRSDAKNGFQPWALTEIKGLMIAPSEPEMVNNIWQIYPEDLEQHPEPIAVHIMETQQKHLFVNGGAQLPKAGGALAAGAFCQLTTLTRAGITTQILKRWPVEQAV